MRVQIGSVVCAISCSETEVYDRLRGLYNNFLSDRPADIYIELNGIERMSPTDLESSLSETRYLHEGNRFRTTSLIITGTYDLIRRTISITGERSLANPDLEFNYLNRLVSMAYYTACKVRYNGNPPALVVHACGILRHGRALLFAGPHGSGKTTIARLCDDHYGQVINDEMVLVSRPTQDGNVPSVHGIPIIGRVSQQLNTTAPLSCILLLKQSERTATHRLNRTDAYLRFIRQIITPAHIGQRDKRAVYSLMADFSDEVTRSTKVYELEFTHDRESLWQAIEQLERSL